MKRHYLSMRWQNCLVCKLGFVCQLVRFANVPMSGWQKLNYKKCAIGKIKNTEGSAMSVGLLMVRLKYGLYVFGH
jgi:hypothetical protein